jgi:hypothetical protein
MPSCLTIQFTDPASASVYSMSDASEIKPGIADSAPTLEQARKLYSTRTPSPFKEMRIQLKRTKTLFSEHAYQDQRKALLVLFAELDSVDTLFLWHHANRILDEADPVVRIPEQTSNTDPQHLALEKAATVLLQNIAVPPATSTADIDQANYEEAMKKLLRNAGVPENMLNGEPFERRLAQFEKTSLEISRCLVSIIGYRIPLGKRMLMRLRREPIPKEELRTNKIYMRPFSPAVRKGVTLFDKLVDEMKKEGSSASKT